MRLPLAKEWPEEPAWPIGNVLASACSGPTAGRDLLEAQRPVPRSVRRFGVVVTACREDDGQAVSRVVMKNDNDRIGIYQKVTDQKIAALEKGPGWFEMPWYANSGTPANAASGKFRRGITPPRAVCYSTRKECPSPICATYKQWQSARALSSANGKRPAIVVFWRFLGQPRAEETEA
jgi:hypothetical protein